MKLKFDKPEKHEPGIFAAMLRESYAPLIESDPHVWGREIPSWEAFDSAVFEDPDAEGACTFLTRSRRRIVGFGSFDPRPAPEFGIIGHNCILPDFQGRGIGKAQIDEILKRFRALGLRNAQVTTCDHEFFRPAQRMYRASGFREIRRRPWPENPDIRLIDYSRPLD